MSQALSPTYQTYGRRRSRRWSVRQEDILTKCTTAIPTFPDAAALLSLFPSSVVEIWAEIGFGYGEHIVGMAKAWPHVGFIGAEVYESGVAATQEQIDIEQLHNTCLFSKDGRLLLDMLPALSLNGIAILFPDPWPKNRHAKRQLVSSDLLVKLRPLLKPNATFRFASDAITYVEKVIELFQSTPDFTIDLYTTSDARPNPETWPITRYEKKALAKGKKCHYLSCTYKP